MSAYLNELNENFFVKPKKIIQVTIVRAPGTLNERKVENVEVIFNGATAFFGPEAPTIKMGDYIDCDLFDEPLVAEYSRLMGEKRVWRVDPLSKAEAQKNKDSGGSHVVHQNFHAPVGKAAARDFIENSLDYSGDTLVNNKSINFGPNANIVGSAITVADSIENSRIQISGSNAPQDLKTHLEELRKAVAELCEHLPSEKAKEVAGDLDTFSKESTRPTPRRKWYELSADGLIQAAKAVGEVAVPVTSAVKPC